YGYQQIATKHVAFQRSYLQPPDRRRGSWVTIYRKGELEQSLQRPQPGCLRPGILRFDDAGMKLS
ncbi:MAG: hypothetical protein WBO97_17395, partial [Tepidiformaceae bacterium]